MEKLNELVEQAKFVADWHGSDWSSALCQDKDGKQAHEIICENRGEAVISTGSNSNEASWLCDYLELCSPANILAIAAAFRELEQRAEAAESEAKHQLSVNILISDHHKRLAAKHDALQAKLAELEKQEPIGYHRGEARSVFRVWPYEDGDICVPVYSRPAPAINLDELVPDEMTVEPFSRPIESQRILEARAEGFNLCRAAILRNIEEAK